jgi:hypothetical protein
MTGTGFAVAAAIDLLFIGAVSMQMIQRARQALKAFDGS